MNKLDGFVLKINACDKQSDYGSHYLGVELRKEGNDCSKNYKWLTRIGTVRQYDSTSWVAESPDGSYIIAVGATNVLVGSTRHIARTITKIDSLNGDIIWTATLPTTDNLGDFRNSGYESVVFTADGGFIVSGFTNNPWDIGSATDGPMFKSGGQVEEGYPMIERFPSSVANANAINENDFVLGKTLKILQFRVHFYPDCSN